MKERIFLLAFFAQLCFQQKAILSMNHFRPQKTNYVITNSIFVHVFTNRLCFIQNQKTVNTKMFFDEDEAVIKYCNFINCSGYKGGALFADSLNIQVLFCGFCSNKASIAGSVLVISPHIFCFNSSSVSFGTASVVCGGLMVDCSITNKQCQIFQSNNFSMNLAPSSSAFDVWDGNPSTHFCGFDSNYAHHQYGNVRTSSYKPNKAIFSEIKMTNNTCKSNGGAYFGFWFNTQAMFEKCYFNNNLALGGRGNSIFIGNGEIFCTINGCVFSNDKLNEIYQSKSSAKIIIDESTLFNNKM